jgi:hypothetical protein
MAAVLRGRRHDVVRVNFYCERLPELDFKMKTENRSPSPIWTK